VLVQLAQSAWLRVPLVIAVALAVQTSIAADVRILGVAPDLMLLLALCGGIVGGPERGAGCGFAIGLAFDLLLQTPFGLSALVYSVAAFGVGYGRLGFERSSWWLRALVVTGASAASVVLYAVLATVFGMTRIVNLDLVTVAVVVSVVNGLLSPLGIPVMRWALLGRDRRPARAS
jgi:rod shape-determining protein MreD